MYVELQNKLKKRNLLKAQQLIAGGVRSDGGPPVKAGEFFTVSTDQFFNSLILTGFNDHWPDRFITHMAAKLESYVTTVFRLEGEGSNLTDISDAMMNQVYERINR